jgi:predicted signal transduction protein with EAL and GGDEF domain
VIAALALATYAVAHVFDLPPKVFQFAIDNVEYEVDDAIFVLFVMSVALVFYVYRRLQDLRKEVEARRSAELNAQKLARHDPLTGLPNRRYFNEKLEEAMQRVLVEGQRAAVLMLDLDGFKAINDVHGHVVGDQALMEIAERINMTASWRSTSSTNCAAPVCASRSTISAPAMPPCRNCCRCASTRSRSTARS